MVTTRLEVDLHKGIVCRSAHNLIIQYRLLAIALWSLVGVRTVGFGVALDPVVERALLVVRTILRNCPIGLLYLLLTYHLVKTRQRLRGLSKYHSAAHRAVDAVHHAKEYCARLMVANLNHRLNLILYSLGAIRVALHEVASMLINHHQVIILVKYIVNSKHRKGGL